MQAMTRVTIRDVARELNLSHTTISRVLNGRDAINIPDATRERVRRTAQDMGYRPNQAARALVTGRTHQIGLWMRHISTAYDAQVIHSALLHLQHTGFRALVADASLMRQAGGGAQELVLEQEGVDGFLVFETTSFSGAGPEQDASATKPLVSMGGMRFTLRDGEGSGEGSHDYVGIDLRGGAEAAVRHLVETGCRRIAIMQPYREARYDGYVSVLHETGLPHEEIETRSPKRTDARAALNEYLDAHPCPDALFAFNDDVALGAYRALRDRGIRVPDDVALVGYDGIEDTEYTERPISTVVQPVEEMCRLACAYLLRRIENPTIAPQQTVLQPQLVIRESSRR